MIIIIKSVNYLSALYTKLFIIEFGNHVHVTQWNALISKTLIQWY